MAADFQNQFPNPCNLSRTGYFGSKFVTICVSGDEDKQISLKGYQVIIYVNYEEVILFYYPNLS